MHFFILLSPIVINCPEGDTYENIWTQEKWKTSKQFGILLNIEYKARNEVVREEDEGKLINDGTDRKRLMKYGRVRRTEEIRLWHRALELSPERRCKETRNLE
jgi:hypothetical protein